MKKRKSKSVRQMIIDDLSDAAREHQEQREEDRAQIQESDLYNVDFIIKYDRSTIRMCLGGLLLLAPFAVRSVLKTIIRNHMLGRGFDLEMSASVIFFTVLVGLAVIFVSVYAICVLRQGEIHVRHSSVFMRDKSWHYKEISQIKVNSLDNMATVYVDGRMIFWIGSDYENFESFLTWAEKCHIPVKRKSAMKNRNSIGENGLESNAVTKYTAIIIILGILIAIVLCMIEYRN
jgi:hypothetical protein